MNAEIPMDRHFEWVVGIVRKQGSIGILVLALAGYSAVQAQTTNSVTGGNGIDYTINGQSDPSLTLQRGITYLFQLSNISGHPFYIKSMLGAGDTGRYDIGVTNNGMTSGTLIFAVANDAPSQLFYQCGIHSSMSGMLNIIDPPTPPPFRVVDFSVADTITIRHTATNSFTFTPEFKTNLVTTNWVNLTVISNFLDGGTNEVICGKPPGSSVFIRVRAQ